jgi:hypothetical protein
MLNMARFPLLMEGMSYRVMVTGLLGMMTGLLGMVMRLLGMVTGLLSMVMRLLGMVTGLLGMVMRLLCMVTGLQVPRVQGLTSVDDITTLWYVCGMT